jgi:SMODS-associating 2TM, beta-strand rich effector domain
VGLDGALTVPSAFWTRVVAALIAAVVLLFALLSGRTVSSDLLRYFSGAASIVVFLLLAFDRWLWRWLPLAVTGRPILDGTWKLTLKSTHVDPRTGSTQPPSECYLVIRQTFSTITVGGLFDSSRSWSMSAEICELNGQRTLWYVYRSEARTMSREGNPPRRGAAALNISTTPRTRLEGDYWTEAGTRGEIETSGYSKRHYQDFGSAKAGDYT